jgi:DHA1 family multidrug resistance protein-like MFS transporter
MASKIATSGVKMEQRVLAWMCLLIGVNQLGFGAIIPVLPLYADSFGVSQTAIGMTVAVYGLARLFTGLPAGRIADLLGRRSALAIGGVSSALGNLWCAYSATFAELIAARFLAGIGAGLTLTAGMIILADITTPALATLEIRPRSVTQGADRGIFGFTAMALYDIGLR